MKRRVIRIDEEKCTGCGLCARECHEGAIAVVNGKARLLRDDYCDGMGDCLPSCPAGAIAFEEREAAEYDPAAVERRRQSREGGAGLKNWPVQIKLAPLKASWLEGAELLIAADCTAYAYPDMHSKLMEGRAVLIACPKLDGVDYSVKLTEIFAGNDITEITIARMLVPCCGGLELAVRRAVEASGKDIPVSVVTISPDGKII